MLFVIQASDQKNPLEEKMATHSTIFFFFFLHSTIVACKIKWTEEPGGLQSMGSQRIGHD